MFKSPVVASTAQGPGTKLANKDEVYLVTGVAAQLMDQVAAGTVERNSYDR